MIHITNVSFSYPAQSKPVLHGITLEISPFSWVVIGGPDGSGKTTLGKLIVGLLQPDSGSIALNAAQDPGRVVAGYLGGDPYDFLVGTSVEEDVVFGLENLGLAPREIGDRLKQALHWTGLEGMEHRLTHTLSGGEQQKLALAAMLAMGTRIVVLDEALSMLDRPTRANIRSLINSLRKDPGLTVVEMTHSQQEALLADRLVFLGNGEVRFDGAPSDFLATVTGRSWAKMAGGIPALREALSRRGMRGGVGESDSDLRELPESRIDAKL